LPDATRAENPLLRSGLALAGADRPAAADGDGLLTALELSGLDLWGTQVVVLSACDPDPGVDEAEAVSGLRRAPFLAGAATVVSSLWKADDAPARELMIAYYRALRAGAGRSEALRQAQLQMLHSPRWSAPASWAGFVSDGDWGPIPTDDPR
jgi:CHAT domain-containing protein